MSGRLRVLDGMLARQSRFVAATVALLAAELADPDELAFALGAVVPRDWPPRYWDEQAVRWLRGHLDAHPEESGWWAAYLVSHDDVVVGTVGLKGPPRDGEVEVGYALVASAFGMGYATDAVATVVEGCAGRDDIDRVVLHTLEGGESSQAVARRAGFVEDGPGPEPGTLRYVRHLDG